jgi:formate hydrogenlyase subunit 3/multisubunit Na+/H+ antiporter MnhD subunit
LIARRCEAVPDAFRYLLFSIGAGYILVAGFAMANAVTGSAALAALLAAGPDGRSVFILLAIGFLIKSGAIGVHVWLPGAYAEADDDLSAMLSAVLSKMAIFGLLVGAYAAIRSEADLSLANVVGWIGMLTALVGAMLALQQDNVKRMLAYSSMSQLGYIVTAIALMSHLGWVTALYLTANHLMTKGILFLVAAAIIFRDIRRSRRACAVHASHLRRRDNCHCRHVRAASACRLRRQVAPAKRDGGERMVWPDRIWCARDVRRLSLHGALYSNDLPRYCETRAP